MLGQAHHLEGTQVWLGVPIFVIWSNTNLCLASAIVTGGDRLLAKSPVPVIASVGIASLRSMRCSDLCCGIASPLGVVASFA